jgi:hypoxanthine phosphoribosyltransferase
MERLGSDAHSVRGEVNVVAGAAVALELSWSDLDGLADELADRIRVGGVPDVIVGVLRGGIVPAVLLAHRLGVRDVRAVAAVRTLDDGPGAAKVAEPVVSMPDTLGQLAEMDVVVVDDVIGGGATLRAVTALVASRVPRCLRTATVAVNVDNWAVGHPESTDPRDAFGLVGTLCLGWVRFPWEAACG